MCYMSEAYHNQWHFVLNAFFLQDLLSTYLMLSMGKVNKTDVNFILRVYSRANNIDLNKQLE